MKACICIDVFLFCAERTAEAAPFETYDVIIAATPADDELVAFMKGGFHELVTVSVQIILLLARHCCEVSNHELNTVEIKDMSAASLVW